MSPRLQQRHRLKEITTQVNVLVSDQTYFRTTPAYDTHRTPIPKPSFLPYAQPYDKTISPAPLQRLQLIRCSPSNPFFPFLSENIVDMLWSWDSVKLRANLAESKFEPTLITIYHAKLSLWETFKNANYYFRSHKLLYGTFNFIDQTQMIYSRMLIFIVLLLELFLRYRIFFCFLGFLKVVNPKGWIFLFVKDKTHKIAWAGFEPLTLGVASSDEDH